MFEAVYFLKYLKLSFSIFMPFSLKILYLGAFRHLSQRRVSALGAKN